MNIEDLEWHDGNIIEAKFETDYKEKSCFIISADFYEEPINSSNRERYTIRCENVKSFNFNCDVDELFDNESSGNISIGALKSNVLRIYFCDGYLEIKANKFSVEKC